MYFDNLLRKWTSFLPYCHHKIYSKENDRFLYVNLVDRTGLEIATDTVANASNIFSLATKNSGLVAKVVTRL